MPGVPIRLWVLDLGGRRAVVSFTSDDPMGFTSYDPTGPQAQAELTAIADSVSFG